MSSVYFVVLSFILTHRSCIKIYIWLFISLVSRINYITFFSFNDDYTYTLFTQDRDRYVTGEFRFRHGYGKGNPRKMVQTWAEKEMRNLSRMYQVGILCPEPFVLRGHVLLMNFLGKDLSWRDIDHGQII